MPEVLAVQARADDGVLADRIDLHPRHPRDEMGIETNSGLMGTEEDLVDVHDGNREEEGLVDTHDGNWVVANHHLQCFCDLQSSGRDVTSPGLEIELTAVAEKAPRCVPIDVRQIQGNRVEQVHGLLRPWCVGVGHVILLEARSSARGKSHSERSNRCEGHSDDGSVRHCPSRAPLSTRHQSRTALRAGRRAVCDDERGRGSCRPGSVGGVSVMRRQVWNDMNVGARDALMRRGIDDIFDPDLRRSIGALIDDVRDRGDIAVCDALARFDGIEIEPAGLRVSADEFERATVSARCRRCDRRCDRPPAGVQRSADGAGA